MQQRKKTPKADFKHAKMIVSRVILPGKVCWESVCRNVKVLQYNVLISSKRKVFSVYLYSIPQSDVVSALFACQMFVKSQSTLLRLSLIHI